MLAHTHVLALPHRVVLVVLSAGTLAGSTAGPVRGPAWESQSVACEGVGMTVQVVCAADGCVCVHMYM